MDSDSARTERLKAVQMADLGTARREFISTADNRSNYSHIGLEELEARRESNVPGTEAFHEAKKDKAHLDKWRNLHKTVGDEGSINAQLEGMMHGQSHRAQLNENMRQRQRPLNTMFEFNMSQPAPPFTFSNFAKMPATNHPNPAPYRGRKGGAIGKKGRGMFTPIAPTGPRTQPAPMTSRLDPALDSNNITAALRGAGIYKSRKPASPLFANRGSSMNRGTSSPPTRATKPNAPVASFKIASPQEFLAQARPSSSASASITALPKVPSPLNPSTQPRKTTGPTTALHVKDKDNKADVPPVPKTDTPTPSPRAPAKKTIVPRPKRVETLARKVEAMAREPSPLPKKIEVTSPTLPIKIPVKANLQDDDKEKEESQSAAGVLLDLVSTATATAEASLAIFSSPSIAELSGIDFSKETLGANVEPPSPSPVGRSANAETIATTAENALYAKKMSELQKKIDKTISDMQKELQKEIDESVLEMQKELAEKLGFAEKFQAGSMSLQRNIPVLPSIPKDNPAKKLVEGGSFHFAKTNVASPLTNVAFPLPNVASPLPNISSFSNVATANEPTTPIGKNFSEYRSPPPTSSSEESKERFYDAAEMNQSPRKSIGTEGIKGFETLKVSEVSARAIHRGPAPIFKAPAVSQSSSQSAPLRTSSGGVGSSIYAQPNIPRPLPMVYEKPTGGLSYEPVALRNLSSANVVTKPVAPIGPLQFRFGASASANVPNAAFPPAKPVTTVGPAPKVYEKPTGELSYEPVALRNLNPAKVATKPPPQFQLASSAHAHVPKAVFPLVKPVATVGPLPYQPGPSASANVPKEVTRPKAAEPISRVKILGPAPYQPKRK